MIYPYFGSISFQPESTISLNLVRFTYISRSLYPIGEWEYYINIRIIVNAYPFRNG